MPPKGGADDDRTEHHHHQQQQHANSVISDSARPGTTPGHRADLGSRAAKATTETTTETAETPAEPPAHRRSGAGAEMAAAVDLLVRALRALGGTGHAELAGRLAGHAWAALHTDHPRAADRINGLLHYLARLPAGEAPSTPSPSSKESVMTTTGIELDVRQEIPARRHELIFAAYGALAAGGHFVLVNDHDPKPLYYQFAAEHADRFTWEYLEQGPEVWRVRIGRVAG